MSAGSRPQDSGIGYTGIGPGWFWDIQGRRFNGRPAVSKTASGGSNPSAPANHPSQVGTLRRKIMATDVKVWAQGTKDYINELKLEMRRVTWPSRKQVESTTGVVIFS